MDAEIGDIWLITIKLTINKKITTLSEGELLEMYDVKNNKTPIG